MPGLLASWGMTVMTERERLSAITDKSGVARMLMKMSRKGEVRMRRAVASTTLRSTWSLAATCVAATAMVLHAIFPSSFTPNPFSRRNLTTLVCEGESANQPRIADHIDLFLFFIGIRQWVFSGSEIDKFFTYYIDLIQAQRPDVQVKS